MAALSDADLRVILGDNYEATLQSLDEEQTEERKKLNARNQLEARMRAFENSRLSAIFLFIGGAVLIWAGWMVAGYSLTVQVMLGVASCLIGLVWFVYLLGAMRKLHQARFAVMAA
ncbi:MAG TPA: hypothetical protein VL402_04825 [Xanthobacteraceae bacterium]|jgi:uncharacterized membrane protein|nr:hypothetical protein [Xanthobacteraceae bacterium]